MDENCYQSICIPYVPNSDLLALQLEFEMLKTENLNLKNFCNDQANLSQRKSDVEAKKLLKFRKEVAEMVVEFNKNLCEKTKIIQKQEMKAQEMMDEISRLRDQGEKLNKKRVMIEDKCIQTDLEVEENSNDYYQSKKTVNAKRIKLEHISDLKQDTGNSDLKNIEDNPKQNPGEPILFSCQKCDKQFELKKKLDSHAKFVHGTRKCLFCEKNFSKCYVKHHTAFVCRAANSYRLILN